MGTRWNRLDEAVLTSTHNLCFWAEIRKIMYTPVNHSFTIEKWGLRGSKLYRHVFVMWETLVSASVDLDKIIDEVTQDCVQLTETFAVTRKTKPNFVFICDSFRCRVANISKLFSRCLTAQPGWRSIRMYFMYAYLWPKLWECLLRLYYLFDFML